MRLKKIFSKPSMTKQSFKDECDINKIMKKFERTGAITHYAKYGAEYGDATQIELQDALNVVARADEMFEELPAAIRKRFSNDPGEFLAFVQDESNKEEMIKLGLRDDKRATQEVAMGVEAARRKADPPPTPDQAPDQPSS